MTKYFPVIGRYVGTCDSLDSEAFGNVEFEDQKSLVSSAEETHFKIAKVPFVLPQEKVEFEELRYRKASYYSPQIILESSKDRIKPPCPHFQICGGCRLQHMSIDFYKQFKLQKLSFHLKKQEISTKIADIVIIPPGLRRKANIEGIKKSEKVFLGFHRFRSRQIINIDECLIIDPKILQKLPPIREMLELLLENFQKVEIFIINMPSGMELGLEIHSTKSLTDIQIQILSDFAQKQNFSRLYFKHGLKTTQIFSLGESYIELSKFKVNINPWAFMQTSIEAEKAILNVISEFLAPILPLKAIDFFCGRGLYSLFLAKNYPNICVEAIDSDKESINALQKVAAEFELSLEASERNLFTQPLNSKDIGNKDVVIINPPRAGAEAQCKELLKSNVRCIIYVSCNPESFARDAKILSPNFDLEKIVPIDQFIWSLHLEVIALFHLKTSK